MRVSVQEAEKIIGDYIRERRALIESIQQGRTQPREGYYQLRGIVDQLSPEYSVSEILEIAEYHTRRNNHKDAGDEFQEVAT
jgi:hypothetical protein